MHEKGGYWISVEQFCCVSLFDKGRGGPSENRGSNSARQCRNEFLLRAFGPSRFSKKPKWMRPSKNPLPGFSTSTRLLSGTKGLFSTTTVTSTMRSCSTL